MMRDGLYIVQRKTICAAFVMDNGKVTCCAPVLQNNIEYYKTIAKWYPTEEKPLDAGDHPEVKEIFDDT